MSNNPYGPPPGSEQPDPYSTPAPGQPGSYGGQQAGSYGAQPQYGQPQYGQPGQQYGQPPYGQPGQPQYGQPQYNQQYGQSQYGYAPAQGALASWGARVGGYLIDGLISIPGSILAVIGIILAIPEVDLTYNPGTGAYEEEIVNAGNPFGIVLALLGFLLAFGLNGWNRWYKGGQGQSLGRRALGITLVSETTGQPIGTGNAFVRDLAHFLDSAACYVGWLFPLWDNKRQTFADKVTSTVVVQGNPQAPR